MSTPNLVPVFSPDGTLGDIPYERLKDALTAGAKPGVTVKSPDGKLGVIPADRVPDAAKAGATVVPFEQQETQHPGFWHSLYSDVSGAASGLYHAAVDPLTETHEDLVKKLHAEQAQEAAPESPERAAHGALYRKLAVPAAEAVGVNVPAMEQSAAEGDPAGVMGHAAAPLAVAAATEGLARGVPAVAAAAKDALPSARLANAGEAFQAVSKVAGKHTVPVTSGLSDSLLQYQQLVDAGGSRSLAVSKLLNRVTDPTKGPLTYDEARLFQSNISRLSADEAQRLTPVMKRQVGQIASELNGAVENTAASTGQLAKFQSAMKEYSAAKTLEARMEVLKKYGIKAGLAALGGGAAAAGAKLAYDVSQQ